MRIKNPRVVVMMLVRVGKVQVQVAVTEMMTMMTVTEWARQAGLCTTDP